MAEYEIEMLYHDSRVNRISIASSLGIICTHSLIDFAVNKKINYSYCITKYKIRY
jgi:hypothetical protein